MNIVGNPWKAEGTGLGQFVEINEKCAKAVIKVDTTTYHQIVKSCQVRRRPAGLQVFSPQLARDISNFMITVNLCLGPGKIIQAKMDTLYGLFINFHWEFHSGEKRIRVTRVEDAISSEWYCYKKLIPDSDEESNSDDESDEEEEAPILKFFKECCLPPQADIEAKIPEKTGKEKALHAPVIRPKRRI
jgi:hypothetical protein